VQSDGVIVAVKKLLHSMPNSLEQFENEIDLLMRLEHPNIVRLIGYCYNIQKQHVPYKGEHVFAEESEILLCLEYMPNGSLDRFLSGMGMTIQCVLFLYFSSSLFYIFYERERRKCHII
jgi:interleukin-1 receptor-associated kinase 1/coatomer subunit beta'